MCILINLYQNFIFIEKNYKIDHILKCIVKIFIMYIVYYLFFKFFKKVSKIVYV